MEKLYEVRKKNIIKPLERDDIGFVFKTENIDQVIKDINDARYGSYLIGGIVGTGKSSLIEMATSFVNKSIFIVHVNFYNEEECIEKFLVILLEKIIEAAKKTEWFVNDAEFYNRIDLCEKRLHYDIEIKGKIEKLVKDKKTEKMNYKSSIMSRIGIGLNYIFSGETHIDAEIEVNDMDEHEKSDSINETITMTKKQITWLAEIENILKAIPCERVIIIYDELDKMGQDVLKELFKKYKSIFVEKNIFHYFLVNENIYSIYSKNDLIQNPYFTYFLGCYYISLLSLEETLRYCKMMFAENNYIKGLCVYYFSLGNYRLINRYYLVQERNDLDLYKAYILKETYKRMNAFYLRNLEQEILLMEIKMVIEEIFKIREFKVDHMIESLNKIKDNGIKSQYKECIENIIDIITVIAPKAIERQESQIILKPETLFNERIEIKKIILNERMDNYENNINSYEKEDIELNDMYDWITKEHMWHRNNIVYLNKNILPLKVAENIPEAYDSVLVNILKSSLYECGIQVIVLKRYRGDESYYKNDYVYTGIVVVDKGYFQIAYYVDEGSYDSDRKDASTMLIEKANEMNIDIKIIEIKNKINLDKEIELIVNAFNKNEFKVDNYNCYYSDKRI